MKSSTRFPALLLAMLALATPGFSQVLVPDAANVFWPGTLDLPPGTPPSPDQFGGFSAITSSPSTNAADQVPASGEMRLQTSTLGPSFTIPPPEHTMGDIIGIPLVNFTNPSGGAVGLRREPVRQNEEPFRYRMEGDPTIHVFTPWLDIIDERFFWSPHARFGTLPSSLEANSHEETTEVGEPGTTTRDGFIYASQPGATTIYWRTTTPIDFDGSGPIFGLALRSTSVASTSRRPVRRIFWTEHGFRGPNVNIPGGEVQQVRVAYNEAIPRNVDYFDIYVPEGEDPFGQGGTGFTDRTLWYDSTLGTMRAYNREGRVIVEFLGELRAGGTGLRRQIGIEVVDVIQEATPASVEVFIGDRLFPLPPEEVEDQPYPLPPAGASRTNTLARIDSLLGEYQPLQVLSLAIPPFTMMYTLDGRPAHYAVRETSAPGDVQFYWAEPGIANILWPRFLNQYRQVWPGDLDEFALNVRPSELEQSALTPPAFGPGSAFQLIHQDNGRALESNPSEFIVNLDGAHPLNRSLLLITAGDSFWFLRVESVLDSLMATDPRYSGFYRDAAPSGGGPLTALAGSRINAPPFADSPAGFVDLTYGDAIDPTAYIDPFAEGFAEAEKGAIIPVNAAPQKAGRDNDQLVVWWFQKIRPPAHLTGRIPPAMFPSFQDRYRLAWPTDAPQIVLASNAGSGDLRADQAAGSIYFQNNPSQAGYNPNEEHAMMIAGRAYALRDDLNHPDTSSSPYVLVRFTNADDNRPDMRAFRVLRENESHIFDYPARAGTVLQPPMPLAVMPPPLLPNGSSANTEVTPDNLDPAVNIPATGLGDLAHYNRFTYEDRKGLKWVYRGQHNPDADIPALGMKFYYATLPGFAYPHPDTGINQAPPVGTITPFLHDGFNGDSQTGTAITIHYRPHWPDRGSRYGLSASYFNNPDLSGTPVLQRTDPNVVFYWSEDTSPHPLVNADNFSIRWEGYIHIPESGTYTFNTANTGGVRLTIGNRDADPVIDAWVAEIGLTTRTSPPAEYRKGEAVFVRLDFFRGSALGEVSLRWTGPGFVNAFIPAAALLSADSDYQEVPSLQFAETLVKAKFGLPSIADAASAHVLYQQSIARNVTARQDSAILHDPTRRKISPLAPTLSALPASILTSTSHGRVYFQNLPAHLQQRVYFDPSISTHGALVLEGKFNDELLGEDYIDLNVLTFDDLTAIMNLLPEIGLEKSRWNDLVNNLNTVLETFEPDPSLPGAFRPAAGGTDHGPDEIVRITHPDQAVDSYALSAVGGGSGYITLILGEGRAFTDPGDPVQMHILRIGPDLYRGQVKPVPSPNPLSESLTMQHTGDFAGQTDLFEFQWFYSPPVNGQPPENRPGEPGATWFAFDDHDGPRAWLGADQPLLALSDNYFVMRHRPIVGHALRPNAGTWGDDDGWSNWTDPALAEGWIKRVLAGINPFNQRVADFFNNAVNTDVSLLTQAGSRWEGNIPLNLDAVQDEGLIAIYETVLRRGMSFTIEGTPAIDYGPANDALLLAAGYLNDLYMALGNEAYADAANPLISLDVDPQRLVSEQSLPSAIGTTIETTASARFAFEGQVPTLLAEELVLLRGRDDFLVPGTRIAPIYNRFVWNYTRGINAGEVIYAVNYNITEKPGGNADGKIDAADAARMFPQGHGDAYGHYLTAIKNYYRLLANPSFTWTPRVEAVNILGTPVTVDYFDERRLAAAATALGRTASRVIDLERRKLPTNPSVGWSALREEKPNGNTGNTRAWGVEQWASRAGQGNFLHWAAANALLPEVDGANEGLQKIDRTTVPELEELATIGTEIQSHLDAANQRLNALNMADGSMLFDLSPSALANGASHFDQVLAKAKAALANAATAHQRTVRQNALLRSVENQAADYTFTVEMQEEAFLKKLLDLYGKPYPGDIGPGKIYPQGYTGPDFFNHMAINRPYVFDRSDVYGIGQQDNWTRRFTLPIRRDTFESLVAGFDGKTGKARTIADTFAQNYNPEPSSTGTFVVFTPSAYLLNYTINLNDGPYRFATPAMGQRPYTGSLQTSLLDLMKARDELYHLLDAMEESRLVFANMIDRFAEDIEAANRISDNEKGLKRTKLGINKTLDTLKILKTTLDTGKKLIEGTAKAMAESLPKSVGLATDVTAPARGGILAVAIASAGAKDIIGYTAEVAAYAGKLSYDILELRIAIENKDLDKAINARARIDRIEAAYRELFASVQDIDMAALKLDAAHAAYRNQIDAGQQLLAERETFRKRAATVIQGARTRDVAFRAFRTESLEQYKILFDQAARYTWLAAQAYDYETGQLGTPAGRQFLAGISSTRALGLVGPDGQPLFAGSQSGDPGLSSYLARLEADWNVAKGRLGINNPDQYGTLFSLRREHFGLPYREDGTDDENTAWQDRLRASLVRDLRTDPVIAAHALPLSNPGGLAQPGFVIDLPTVIESGLNHFGNPLAAGDGAFSSASFATKIHSVGVVFQGYLGMNPYGPGSTGIPAPPTHNHPDALASAPYVYLIPGGADVMRTPPLGGIDPVIRQWNVHDHAMPLPFDIGNGGFGENTLWTANSSLTEPFFLPRKHQPFRAVADPTLFYSTMPDEFTNRRLVGRSAWNTQWKLVIPAQPLLADPEEGIERFIRSVRDVKLFLRTYSHAGN